MQNLEFWRLVLYQQHINNVQQWAALLENSEDPLEVIRTDYENLLRALEATLSYAESFDAAYQLLEKLFPYIMGLADWQRWEEYLEKALILAQKLGKDHERAKLLQQLGNIHYHSGRLASAEEYYKTITNLYQQVNDQKNHALALTRLALINDSLGRKEEAILLCKRVITIAEELNDNEIAAHAYLNLSRIHRLAGEWNSGLETAAKAYAYFDAVNNQNLVNVALLNQIGIWAELGQWENVEKHSEELTEKLIAVGDTRTLSQLKNNLGIVAFNQKDYLRAEAAWDEALLFQLQLQEPSELAGIYNNLGMVYVKLSEWKAAYDNLQKAIAIYDELGNRFLWANSMDNLADLYEAQDDRKACYTILKKAVDKLEQFHSDVHVQELTQQMEKRLEKFT